MKYTNQKKAFTIVELVIVIAIIAVLAGVLVPTFTTIVKKAKISNDTQLVKNLNTALVADAAVNGKHATMQSALDAAFKFGYDVSKINATANGNEILWDSANDVFCYWNDGTLEYVPDSVSDANKITLGSDSYKLWKIYGAGETVPAAGRQTFSIYLNGAEYTTDENGALVVSVGFDAGTTAGITSVSYVSADDQNVVIRTNSFNTTLTVNAPLGIVNHYDKAYSVDIIKCDMHSYNEYGSIASRINLAEGHVYLESGSSVSNVIVKELADGDNTVTPTSENHKVTVENGATVTNVYSTVSGVTPNVDGDGKDAAAVFGSLSGKSFIINPKNWAAPSGNSLDNGSFNYWFKQGEKNTVTLLMDQSITNNLGSIGLLCRKGYDVTIDLNGFTLTISSGVSLNIGGDGEELGTGLGNVTIKNGTIKSSGSAANVALLKVNSGSILNLENVTIETTGSGVFPNQKASSVTIRNSTINVKGLGIATNAGEGSSEDVTINVESTKIYSERAGICLNVSGTLNVSKSYIEADEQGVMVRAGNAVISDSEIHAKYFGTVGSNTDYSNTKRSDEAWGTGNAVMCGAVVVGDYCQGSYLTAAYCSLNNVAITAESGWTRGLIVVSADSDAATFLKYDDKCTVNGAKIDGCSTSLSSNKMNELYIHDVDIVGITKGSITVNDSVVRPNATSGD